MTCKYVEVKTLSNTEESMRWYLQEKHNHAQKYRDADVLTEWNEAMLFYAKYDDECDELVVWLWREGDVEW